MLMTVLILQTLSTLDGTKGPPLREVLSEVLSWKLGEVRRKVMRATLTGGRLLSHSLLRHSLHQSLPSQQLNLM